METLRDSTDAKEWQEAVKGVLLQELQERATLQSEALGPTMQTLHAAVELFQNNKDMVPGTKQFDPELARRFAEFAEPYIVREDGKHRGYSIPVQPLVERIRAQLVKERSAKPAAPAPAAPPAPVRKPADPPQAAIQSKAGQGAEDNDFSTLFGTIGMPDFRI